jgi:TolB protein
MTLPPETSPSERPPRPRRRRGWSVRIPCGGVLLLFGLNLLLIGGIIFGLIRLGPDKLDKISFLRGKHSTTPSIIPSQASTPSPTLTTTLSPTTLALSPTSSHAEQIQPSSTPYFSLPSLKGGILILSLAEGVDTHLFAYQPESLPLTRLTSGPWDDINPALSPDGKKLAFASNRNGYWDLYVLELATGNITRLTDSLEYDASPSWSPDGVWLAFESYVNNNLEIYIRPVTGSEAAMQLTNNPGADYSPAWAPAPGRRIAFVSTRTGEPDIWIIDLDQPDEAHFLNASHNAQAWESHPTWSPGGDSLAWASVEEGFHNIVLWDSTRPDIPPRSPGTGDWPVWSPNGDALLTSFLAPNHTYLTAYPLRTPGLVFPPLPLSGEVEGLTWGYAVLSWPLADNYRPSVLLTPTPLWAPALTQAVGDPATDLPAGRLRVVPLPADVQAPYPRLHDAVDEAFQALRARLTTDLGWDFLSSLENAFIPLTATLDPGRAGDWLYTGRAMAVTTLPMNAGWLVVVREDFGSETYWRLYLRARFQDGSTGQPLHALPWDFNARFGGNTSAYEQGGALFKAIPPGYWVDFTTEAAIYGWERLPALSTWRAAYPEALFNEFILANGLDWRSAMLELYPPEALVIPTAVVPLTRTPTPTLRWYQSPTPTRTYTPRPTYTPVSPTPAITDTPVPTAPPTLTPRPTRTNSPTRTPGPSLTRTPPLTQNPNETQAGH